MGTSGGTAIFGVVAVVEASGFALCLLDSFDAAYGQWLNGAPIEMTDYLLIIAGVLLLVQTVLLVLLFLRAKSGPGGQLDGLLGSFERGQERLERLVREEMASNREEAGNSARQGREEAGKSLNGFSDSLMKRMTDITTLQKNQFDTFVEGLGKLVETNEKKLEEMRGTIERKLGQLAAEAAQNGAQGREEMSKSLKAFGELLLARMTEIATLQKNQLDTFAASLTGLTQSNEQKLEQMRQTVEGKLAALQADNAQKLEQMRATVDEKLHATLEQRLGESFKLVSERLEQVHKGLGEMQALASGVGDLKKVLSNIKIRGTWGEVQLGNLLEQMLTPDQYAANVQVNPETLERVEYAVKLPGRDSTGKPVWLPIDAKFPQEDYQRLADAADRGDADAVASAAAALEARIYAEARKIRDKYVSPPSTTDFAIMFLPTEGLFAEVLRRPGLCDGILHESRVVLTGPTTLAAVLSSLQMGFRTLAIERRSSEVWQVLGAVKTEFGRFGEVLDRVHKKLQEASNTIESAQQKKRAVERKLTDVQELPVEEAGKLFEATDTLGPAGELEA